MTSGSGRPARVARQPPARNTAARTPARMEVVVDSVTNGPDSTRLMGSVRPHGPPPQGQHPRRPQSPGRAHRREGRRRRQIILAGLRRDRRRRPLRPGHPERTWPDRHRHLDRARDAGRRPLRRDAVQGFASGLYTNPDAADAAPAQQKARLLHYQDLIKVGLSGTSPTTPSAKRVKGSQVDYNGAPRRGAPATPSPTPTPTTTRPSSTPLPSSSPRRRAPRRTGPHEAARHGHGHPLAGPGQAGTDLLRSKSLDCNSYDSGDWFNAIHWNCAASAVRGVPTTGDSATAAHSGTRGRSRPQIEAPRPPTGGRSARPSGRCLQMAAEVQSALSFPLSGTDETPCVITMRLGDLVRPQRHTGPGGAADHPAGG